MPDAKVIVVTGAGSGIGRATAIEAARAGFGVVAISLVAEQLNELAGEIAQSGGSCVTLQLDVTSAGAPQRIVQTAQEHFGRLDVIVNCAGAATSGPLLEQSEAQIDAQWHLHVTAPLRILRAALPLLRQSRGQVMFVGSGLARVPSPYYGAYCAAKAAVRAVATQLRRELHDTGIAVTYIDPGSVRTDFGKNAGFEATEPDWMLATPEHVARRIIAAIRTRRAILNAVPWHTVVATLGEWFPHATDRAMRQRTPPMPVPEPPPPLEVPTESTPQPMPMPQPPPSPSPSDFERALEPVSRRMERVKLPSAFLAELLRPGDEVQLADAAMRWAGMPNKNERAALAEALDALTASGFLEKTGDDSWRVVRSAG
jgi:short-subunit dehydrogenase